MKRAWAKRLLAVALVAATVWYLTATVTAHWDQLRTFRWEVRPWRLLASVLALGGVLAWGVWVWSRVVKHFVEVPVRLGSLQRIWFLSNLARYVPGKIFQFVAVAQLGRTAGLASPVLLTSLLVHTGASLLAAAVLGAWTVPFPHLARPTSLLLAAATTTAAIALVHPAVLNMLLALLQRLAKRSVVRWNASWGDGAAILWLGVFSWMLYGAAYYLFVSAVANVPPALLPQMAGVNALSFVAGYLSPLPGGAGLREIAMTELLQSYVAPGVAVVLAVASRLWTIAAELLGGAAVLLLVRGAPPASPAAAAADAVSEP